MFSSSFPSTSAWIPPVALQSSRKNRPTSTSSHPSFPIASASPPSPSRRNALHALIFLPAALLPNLLHPIPATSAPEDPLKTYTSSSVDASITYPASWFRSDRSGSLIVCNLKDAVFATVSERAVTLTPSRDPFDIAYDVMHVRIEREAAQIFIKEAAFQDDALHFRFESDTSMPNGDLIVRYGIAVCLPRADHLVSCVFTAPKGSWDTYLPIAEELLSSLRLPS